MPLFTHGKRDAPLRNSRDRGELGGETDVGATAAFLTSQVAGLAVLARSGASTAELSSIVETAMAAVGAPKT